MDYSRELEVQIVHEGEIVDTLTAIESMTQSHRDYLDSHLLIEVKNEGGNKELYDTFSKVRDGVYKLELGYFSVGEYHLEVLEDRVLLTKIEKGDNKYKYERCD